ncbi:MAG: helix-turn-helix domain-containing protein [Conexivisphaerales archaeon]
MIKALKGRLYPNEQQKVLLKKHFGACRWVYNHFLEVRDKYCEHIDRGLTVFETMKMLTASKDVTWLNEVNSQSLQHSLVKLDVAFKSTRITKNQKKAISTLSCHLDSRPGKN